MEYYKRYQELKDESSFVWDVRNLVINRFLATGDDALKVEIEEMAQRAESLEREASLMYALWQDEMESKTMAEQVGFDNSGRF